MNSASGAIRVNGSLSIQIDNCNFENNSHSPESLEGLIGGGAILVANVQKNIISNSNFSNNYANGEGAKGGAIYVFYSNFVSKQDISSNSNAFSNCRFSENHVNGTNGFGGAVSIQYTSIVLDRDITLNINNFSNCTFFDNYVYGDKGYGGAINIDYSSLIIKGNINGNSNAFSNCSFFNNYIHGINGYGGAINIESQLNYLLSNGGSKIISSNSNSFTNCIFSNNSVIGIDGFGGAVCFLFISSAYDNTITSNFNTFSNCNFFNNNINGEGGHGGAVNYYISSTNNNFITFNSNSFSYCNFSDNFVNGFEGKGGAFHAFFSSSTASTLSSNFNSFLNCNFFNNYLNGGGQGGAVYVSYISNTGNTFSSNYNIFANCNSSFNYVIGNKGQGGAFYLGNSQNNSINSCFFSNNSALIGGAIASIDSQLSISSTNFLRNIASQGGNGGAISLYYFSQSYPFDCFGCYFGNNSVSSLPNLIGKGGAFYVQSIFDQNPLISFDHCKFEGNLALGYGGNGEAGSNGGALALSLGNYQSQITNSDFYENQALGKGSALWILEGSRNYFENCSFYGNHEVNETQTHSIDIFGGLNQFQSCVFEKKFFAQIESSVSSNPLDIATSLPSSAPLQSRISDSIGIVGGIENSFINTNCDENWFPQLQQGNNPQGIYCLTCELSIFIIKFYFILFYFFALFSLHLHKI